MAATIKYQRLGGTVEHEARFDGDRWESDDPFTADFLNAFSTNWQLSGYYPDPVAGVAIEVAQAVGAKFVSADPLSYEGIPADAIF